MGGLSPERCLSVLRAIQILEGETIDSIVRASHALDIGGEPVSQCLETLRSSGLIKLCRGRVELTPLGRRALREPLARVSGKASP